MLGDAGDHLLPSYRQPTQAQERGVIVAALVLLLACLVTVPFGIVPLRRFDAFIPIVDTVLFLGDVLTATLLFAQGAVLRSRALLSLATGYLFGALLIVPHALAFPGTFSPTGLLGASPETSVWLYVFWHVGLPVAVICYALRVPGDTLRQFPATRVRRAVLVSMFVAILLAAAVTLLATVGQRHLFSLMADWVRWVPARVIVVAPVPFGLIVVAIAMVWRRPRAMLDLWLALALWAWLMELSLALSTTARFTAGWYAGRFAGMLSGVCVLVMLLSETSRLYARLSLAITAQQREREGRLMTLNAVAASVAHDVKQPLAAIVVDAGAGLAVLEHTSPDLKELSIILAAIESEGQRAGGAVDSIRAMFANRPSERVRFDANKLIRESAALMSAEFALARVMLSFELDESLPPIFADRRQIQHVLLNLLTNSIEAMSRLDTGRPRQITIRSAAAAETTLQITVEDSGTGFAPGQLERLFDAFFTTKTHGTGMGLSLCRSIVLSHGGRLWAVSREPHGVALQVRLPIGDASSPSG